MAYCEDCGCKSYNGACTNCHEEIYIEEQYYETELHCPDTIADIAQMTDKNTTAFTDVLPSCGAANIDRDIYIPTPQEVASALSHSFTEDQAADIAEHVYQPLREIIKELALKG